MHTCMAMTVNETGALSQLFGWGSNAWPELQLDYCVFEQYFDTRGLVAAAIERNVAPDLFLACACAHAIPGSIAIFDLRFRALIDSAARAYDDAPSFRDDVRQELHTHLFVADGDKLPRIAQYHARGPLAAWVTTSARRVALRMAKRRAAQKYAGDEALVMQVCNEQNPELAWLRTRYSDLCNEALLIAFRQLSQRDRLIVRLQVQRGLSMARIAIMYNVTQPTISRWMRDAREQILRAFYEFIREECDIERADLDSLVRLVQSQLDLNLSTLFQDTSESVPPEPQGT
jgi:RNA polymerase sigma-70 factor (ECF subfamily)